MPGECDVEVDPRRLSTRLKFNEAPNEEEREGGTARLPGSARKGVSGLI